MKRIITAVLIIYSTLTYSKTEFEKLLDSFKFTETHENYATQNQLRLFESRPKVYFKNLNEEEKKVFEPEYPDKPGIAKRAYYHFVKIDFEENPNYYAEEVDIYNERNYVMFLVKEDLYVDEKNELLLLIKNTNENWFHMGAIDFKSGNDLVRINFEKMKLGYSFWFDNLKSGDKAEEYIAFSLTDKEREALSKFIKENEDIEIVLYSDYDNVKKSRKLTGEERLSMMKMYDFYEYDKKYVSEFVGNKPEQETDDLDENIIDVTDQVEVIDEEKDVKDVINKETPKEETNENVSNDESDVLDIFE